MAGTPRAGELLRPRGGQGVRRGRGGAAPPLSLVGRLIRLNCVKGERLRLFARRPRAGPQKQTASNAAFKVVRPVLPISATDTETAIERGAGWLGVWCVFGGFWARAGLGEKGRRDTIRPAIGNICGAWRRFRCSAGWWWGGSDARPPTPDRLIEHHREEPKPPKKKRRGKQRTTPQPHAATTRRPRRTPHHRPTRAAIQPAAIEEPSAAALSRHRQPPTAQITQPLRRLLRPTERNQHTLPPPLRPTDTNPATNTRSTKQSDTSPEQDQHHAATTAAAHASAPRTKAKRNGPSASIYSRAPTQIMRPLRPRPCARGRYASASAPTAPLGSPCARP